MKHLILEARMASSQNTVQQLSKIFPGQVELRFIGSEKSNQTEVIARVTGPNNTSMDVSIPQAQQILEACTNY